MVHGGCLHDLTAQWNVTNTISSALKIVGVIVDM